MSAPSTAPRTGARPKTFMNGFLGKQKKSPETVSITPPPAPTRKKKKKSSAPSPPNGSLMMPPMNSTMTGSASSLLTVRDDISVIRPQSVMSNGSLSSVSTVRSHKKRRAPPPPVRIITVVDDNIDDENLDDTEKLLETTSSPKNIDVQNESHNDVYASVNKLSKEEGETHDTPIIIDTIEDIHESDGYEVGESAIILSDENEGGDHIYEQIEVIKDQKSIPEDLEIPVLHGEEDMVVTKEPAVQPVEERKKEKKKKKSKDKTDEEKSKKKKKKKKEATSEESENRVPSIEEIVLKSEAKPGDDSRDKKVENDDAVTVVGSSDKTELPSFRGAKAAEVHKLNDSLERELDAETRKESSQGLDNEAGESDVLVDSDDELVDLFAKRKQENKIAKSDQKNAKRAKHVRQRDKDDGRPDDGYELVNNLDDSTYLSEDEDEELHDKSKDKTQKISPKEIEERKKREIIQSMPTVSSKSSAPQTDAEFNQSHQTNEADLINALKILQTEPEGAERSGPAYPRERRAVELDIESEEEMLPSLTSSRASSVINLVSEEEGANVRHELDQQFAVREMQRGAGAKVKTIEESEDNHEAFTTVHEAVAIGAENEGIVQKIDSPPLPRRVPDIETEKVSSIPNDLIENSNKKRGAMPRADVARIHVDVGEVTNDLENASVADSVKSPSPDSGIHDFTDSCSSPVSVIQEDQAGVRSDPRHSPAPSFGLKEDPVIGLDHVQVREEHYHVPDLPEKNDASHLYERVELPKTHNLNKVLFSMSSYNDRKCVEQSSDLFRTQESYTELADKLNTSLAARQKLKQGPELSGAEGGLGTGARQRETKPRVPVRSRNYDKNAAHDVSAGAGPGPAVTGYGPTQAPPRAPQNYAEVTHGPESGLNPISRAEDRAREGRPHAARGRPEQLQDQQNVRSKIIEEFQAKKGILILNRSNSNSLEKSESSEMSTATRFSSLERGGGYFARARPRQEESHYDSPRSLMTNSRGGHYDEDQYLRGGGGPPSISLGVWGDQPRYAEVRVREDSLGEGPGHGYSSSRRQLSPPPAFSAPTLSQKYKEQGSDNNNTIDERKYSQDRNRYAAPASMIHQPPKQIEIRYKNGNKAAEIIPDPRKEVLQGSRTSRGDYEDEELQGRRVRVELPVRPKLLPRPQLLPRHLVPGPVTEPEPAIVPRIFEKKYREEPRERSDYHPSSESTGVLPNQTFYFGQSPPKYKHPAPPTAPPTAIGKVKHNEALSQPFRLHPRHDQRKSSSNTLPKQNSVPKTNENDPKIVIVSSQPADNDVTMNNNQTSTRNLNSSSKLPPKERDQEEVNREFQSELMRAKAKLSKVGGQKSTYIGDVPSQDTPPAPPAPVMPPGPPGPPPPPLVKASVGLNTRPSAPRAPASGLNAREELMMAIRTKGGAGGLRKTGLSNY